MSVPNSKGQEITGRIEVLSKRSEVSPFEVKSLERDIDKLVSVDAAEAYMLGGMLAAIMGEYPKSKTLHEKSLRLNADVVGYFNYGVSMKKVGDLTSAKELFTKAAELSPRDRQVFFHRMQVMTFLLDYEDLDAVINRVKSSDPDFDVEEFGAVKDAREFLVQLERLDISVGQVKRVGLCVEQALLKFGLGVAHMVEKISSFDGVSHLYLEMCVDTNSARQLVEVNEYLMDLILEDSSIEVWDKLIVNVARREHVVVDAGVQYSAA